MPRMIVSSLVVAAMLVVGGSAKAGGTRKPPLVYPGTSDMDNILGCCVPLPSTKAKGLKSKDQPQGVRSGKRGR